MPCCLLIHTPPQLQLLSVMPEAILVCWTISMGRALAASPAVKYRRILADDSFSTTSSQNPAPRHAISGARLRPLPLIARLPSYTATASQPVSLSSYFLRGVSRRRKLAIPGHYNINFRSICFTIRRYYYRAPAPRRHDILLDYSRPQLPILPSSRLFPY